MSFIHTYFNTLSPSMLNLPLFTDCHLNLTDFHKMWYLSRTQQYILIYNFQKVKLNNTKPGL